jgi:acetyl-CoA carboxylase biotin carboxyl carrier protein
MGSGGWGEPGFSGILKGLTMNNEELRQLVDLLKQNDEVGEIEISRNILGVSKIRVARVRGGELSPISHMAVPAAVHAPQPGGSEISQPDSPGQGTVIKAQMVGTFYRSANPDSPPFISEGDRITPGKVLCIIEAMKLMNEIESDCSGVVREILVENGETVEFGQPLFSIE